MSSDPDPEVRASALIGLAYVAVSIKSTSETKEKAAFQLVSLKKYIVQFHEKNISVFIATNQNLFALFSLHIDFLSGSGTRN